MAIFKCPECGRKISEFANFCVGCGCTMKKIKEIIKQKQTKLASKPQPQAKANKDAKFRETLNAKDLNTLNTLTTKIRNTFNELKGKEYNNYYGYTFKKGGFRCFTFVKHNNKLVLKYRKKLTKNSDLILYNSASLNDVSSIIAFLDALTTEYNGGISILKKKPVSTKIDVNTNYAIPTSNNIEKEPSLKELRKKYKYTNIEGIPVRIEIYKIRKEKDKYQICYNYSGGSDSCPLEEADNLLFLNELYAKMYSKLPAKEVIPQLKKPGTTKRFIIVDFDSGGCFAGFKKVKKYETAGREAHEVHGSFDLVEVPEFTGANELIYRFYTEEGAKKIVDKLSPFYKSLRVVED